MGKWIEQLVVFFDELKEKFGTADSGVYLREDNFIDDPMTEASVHRLHRMYGTIPGALIDFYRTETECVSYVYCVSRPYFFGGPQISSFPRINFPDQAHLFSVREWGKFQEGSPVESAMADLAYNSVAFLHVSNGDSLVLDVREGDDPPVYYLKHDGESSDHVEPPISSSFSKFMVDWQKLCYIGPDYYSFEDFSLLNTLGQLDASLDNVYRLREKLGLKNTP
jgi:hypothetical protein